MNEHDANQSSFAGAATGHERHSLQAYVSDMLALERHIKRPVARQTQIDDTTKYPEAMRIITQLERSNEEHIAALEARLAALGGNAASPIKSAVSAFLGLGAAAIDSARKTKVSKNLRDDYTALGLASISYTMLHTTALGMDDSATAALAKHHLDDTAALVIAISNAMPGVVLQELQDDGERVSPGVQERALQDTRQSWSNAGTPSG